MTWHHSLDDLIGWTPLALMLILFALGWQIVPPSAPPGLRPWAGVFVTTLGLLLFSVPAADEAT